MKLRWERLHLGVLAGIVSVICGNGLLGGCAAVVPVAGDVAGTAVDKTSEVVRAGKVESFQAVSKEEAIAAARRAAGKLDLKFEHEERHPDQLKLIYHDQRKQIVVITLVRRTDRATEVRVDVGLFGSEGLGQLVMHEILHELPGATQDEKHATTDAATEK